MIHELGTPRLAGEGNYADGLVIVRRDELAQLRAQFAAKDQECERLRGALQAYQKANRANNDSESELFELGAAALAARPATGDNK